MKPFEAHDITFLFLIDKKIILRHLELKAGKRSETTNTLRRMLKLVFLNSKHTRSVEFQSVIDRAKSNSMNNQFITKYFSYSVEHHHFLINAASVTFSRFPKPGLGYISVPLMRKQQSKIRHIHFLRDSRVLLLSFYRCVNMYISYVRVDNN